MDNDHLVKSVADFVHTKLSGEGSGHDWWHIYRVWKTAKDIAIKEDANIFIVELAALLHDIADHKFHNGNLKAATPIIDQLLNNFDVDKKVIESICYIVENVSFKGAHVADINLNLEGKIVQDADRLDAIGAIGIARAFAYGGYKGRELYNPSFPPEMHNNFDAYRTSTSPTINHFYEKLLLLKDRMHTPTAKQMAEDRHRFMERYLDQFYQEWEGKK